MSDVRIVDYSARHPEGYILGHGGHIFMAEADGRVVDGCALPLPANGYERANIKMVLELRSTT